MINMMPSYGRSPIENIVYKKYGEPARRNAKSWYDNLLSYLIMRYSSIEERVIGTFRYVDCHPDNQSTFSYEFASILRDAGSTFGSVMDTLVKETEQVSNEPNMNDYKKWLLKNIPNIRFAIVMINYPLPKKILAPFSELKDENQKLDWWESYNNVKHSDIGEYKDGNLRSALNSVAANAILLVLIRDHMRVRDTTKLFPKAGIFSSEDTETVLEQVKLF